MIGIPKKPADRDNRLRELAENEACTVQSPGGVCDPATTVWAHTNSQADQKGMGYKGRDSAGFFACSRCHKLVDQPGPSDPPVEVRERYVRNAQARTDVRLMQIALSPTMRPWKVEVARRTLERRGINCD